MDPVTLVGGGAAIIVAAAGGIFKLLHNINAKFSDVGEKIDRQTLEIREMIAEKDVENVQRLTRLETLVNGYNGTRRKRP